MKNPTKAFEDFLAKNASRFTPQKRKITTAIFERQDHFEVESFIDTLRKKNKTISRATVYRTVKQLLDAGLLQKITTKEGKVFYERNVGNRQHDHIICNNCGKILEIKEHIIEKYLSQYCEKIGFKPAYRSLHIYGECKECA